MSYLHVALGDIDFLLARSYPACSHDFSETFEKIVVLLNRELRERSGCRVNPGLKAKLLPEYKMELSNESPSYLVLQAKLSSKCHD